MPGFYSSKYNLQKTFHMKCNGTSFYVFFRDGMKLSFVQSTHMCYTILDFAIIERTPAIPASDNMLEFKFDTQLLIEGHDLDEDVIFDYITEHFEGDCLLAVGGDELITIHFHTNRPWEILEYASSLGEIYDIVVENMERQEQGLQG